jgi:putative membrane protein
MDGWGLGMGLWWLFWIALLVLLVVLVWHLVQGSGRKESDESPLEILMRRYARGELDRSEFEAGKRDLR